MPTAVLGEGLGSFNKRRPQSQAKPMMAAPLFCWPTLVHFCSWGRPRRRLHQRTQAHCFSLPSLNSSLSTLYLRTLRTLFPLPENPQGDQPQAGITRSKMQRLPAVALVNSLWNDCSVCLDCSWPWVCQWVPMGLAGNGKCLLFWTTLLWTMVYRNTASIEKRFTTPSQESPEVPAEKPCWWGKGGGGPGTSLADKTPMGRPTSPNRVPSFKSWICSSSSSLLTYTWDSAGAGFLHSQVRVSCYCIICYFMQMFEAFSPTLQ